MATEYIVHKETLVGRDYWSVYRLTEDDGAYRSSSVRHDTADGAWKEAERKAKASARRTGRKAQYTSASHTFTLDPQARACWKVHG